MYEYYLPKKISELDLKRDRMVSILGKVLELKENGFILLDDSGKVEVISEEKEVLPLVSAECTKCGHSMAYHWEIQTRAADEPATRFFKCEKCKHTWREYK